jgi:hypothetical protein
MKRGNQAQPKPGAEVTTAVMEHAAPSQRRRTRMAIGIMIGILLLNLIGFSGLWLASVPKAERALMTDLAQHIAHITTFLHTTDIFDSANGTALQTELAAASADLHQLDTLLPFGGTIGSDATRMHEGILMAANFCDAIQNLFGSILLVEPGLRTFVALLLDAPGIAPNGVAAPLTLATINQSQRLLLQSRTTWALVQQDYALLGNGTVADAFGISATNINTFLRYIDATYAAFSAALPAVSAVLDNLPVLLGILQPAQMILAVQDPDELTPFGGAIGSYAWLHVNAGRPLNRLRFKDIVSLDCPQRCVNTPLPAQYSWFKPPDGVWDVRSGGISSDIITAGALFSTLVSNESGVMSQGFLFMTPKVLQHILQISGPVAVPALHLTITAQTLPDALHQIHLQSLTQSGFAANTPTMDEYIVNGIIGALAHLSDDQLRRIGTTFLQDFYTRDIQIYTVYSRVQNEFTALGATGIVPEQNDDILAVVDTDLGNDFASADVTQHIADRIVLGANGLASHTLTLSYTYTPSAQNAANASPYADLVQVKLPPQIPAPHISGSCQAVHIHTASHTVAACRLRIAPGATVTLHITWTTPLMEGHIYRLILQRQTGTAPGVAISMAMANGAALATTTPGASTIRGIITWSSAALSSDMAISANIP